MGRKIDVGGYFDKITQGARGGRRLETGDTATDTTTTDTPAPRPPRPAPAPSRGSGGGLKDKLRDILVGGGRGRQPAPQPAPTRPTTTNTGGRRELPSEGVVSIEYSPKMDGDPDPGDVVWVWVPFEEDPAQGKDRPVIVVGRRGRSLVGVPLTTKRYENEAQLEVGVGDWDPKGRVGYARLWRMLDIDPTEMRREGAVLDRKRFDLLVKAIDQYYDIKLPQPGSGRSGSAQSDDY